MKNSKFCKECYPVLRAIRNNMCVKSWNLKQKIKNNNNKQKNN